MKLLKCGCGDKPKFKKYQKRKGPFGDDVYQISLRCCGSNSVMFAVRDGEKRYFNDFLFHAFKKLRRDWNKNQELKHLRCLGQQGQSKINQTAR